MTSPMVSRKHQIMNFGYRASASVFNVASVWFIFWHMGAKFGGELYLHLSSIIMTSTLTRLGVDQSLLLSAKEVIIPTPFLIVSTALSGVIYTIAENTGFTPKIDLPILLLLVFLAHVISYLEAIIRTLPESAALHSAVIGIQSLCIVISVQMEMPSAEILALALTLQTIFYASLIYSKNSIIRFDNKLISAINLSGLVHGSHGLINQNFINYFVTRFGSAAELPHIITIIRILYLSSWPLSQFTFSNIYEKSKGGNGFKDSGLFWGACVLSIVCFLVMITYTQMSSVPGLSLLGLILGMGIISFSIGADKMYRETGSTLYRTLFLLQLFIAGASLWAGQKNLLSNTIICSIFSTYLITCSLSSRYHR